MHAVPRRLVQHAGRLEQLPRYGPKPVLNPLPLSHSPHANPAAAPGLAAAACALNTYKSNTGAGTCSQCPTGSQTLQPGSTSVNECLCSPGRTGSATQGCSLCPVGTYKSIISNAACTSCPARSTTTATGQTSIAACQCLAGYTGTAASGCEACPAGTYKTSLGSDKCTACPENTITLTDAATSVLQCVCKPGFRGPAGGPCTRTGTAAAVDAHQGVRIVSDNAPVVIRLMPLLSALVQRARWARTSQTPATRNV